MQKFQRLFPAFVRFCSENEECQGMKKYNFVGNNYAIVQVGFHGHSPGGFRTNHNAWVLFVWNGISWQFEHKCNDEGGTVYYWTYAGAYQRAKARQATLDAKKMAVKEAKRTQAKVQTKLNKLGINNAIIEGERVCLPADKFLAMN